MHALAVTLALPAPFLAVAPPTCRSRIEHPYRGLSDLRHFRLLRYWHRLARGEMQDCQGTGSTSLLSRSMALSAALCSYSLGLCSLQKTGPSGPIGPEGQQPQENQGMLLDRLWGTAPHNQYTRGTKPVQSAGPLAPQPVRSRAHRPSAIGSHVVRPPYR
jgi:hypothetical protein